MLWKLQREEETHSEKSKLKTQKLAEIFWAVFFFSFSRRQSRKSTDSLNLVLRKKFGFFKFRYFLSEPVAKKSRKCSEKKNSRFGIRAPFHGKRRQTFFIIEKRYLTLTCFANVCSLANKCSSISSGHNAELATDSENKSWSKIIVSEKRPNEAIR